GTDDFRLRLGFRGGLRFSGSGLFLRRFGFGGSGTRFAGVVGFDCVVEGVGGLRAGFGIGGSNGGLIRGRRRGCRLPGARLAGGLLRRLFRRHFCGSVGFNGFDQDAVVRGGGLELRALLGLSRHRGWPRFLPARAVPARRAEHWMPGRRPARWMWELGRPTSRRSESPKGEPRLRNPLPVHERAPVRQARRVPCRWRNSRLPQRQPRRRLRQHRPRLPPAPSPRSRLPSFRTPPWTEAPRYRSGQSGGGIPWW